MIDLSEATLAEKVEYVKGTLTSLDVLEMLEYEDEIHQGKIRSFENPTERTPSLHLYEDGWYDFSTARYGDVIDLAMALMGGSFFTVVQKLCRGIDSLDLDPTRCERQVTAEPPDLTSVFEARRSESRPIPALSGVSTFFMTSLATHGAIGLDHTGNVMIPHVHEGRMTGIKIRLHGGGKSSHPGSVFSIGLYRSGSPRGEPRHSAVITEGESDCWALEAYGLDADVFALPTGAGTWKDRWLEPLGRYETIFTAFDNDRAGHAATEKVRSAIGWGRWKGLEVPTLYNDVREAIAAGWSPKL
jgi:hypothetical protein